MISYNIPGSILAARGVYVQAMRIEYSVAVYHVAACGNRRGAIFTEEEDNRVFLRILGEAVKRFNLLCHAYCLMGNHYHLIVETVDANLSRAVLKIQTNPA